MYENSGGMTKVFYIIFQILRFLVVRLYYELIILKRAEKARNE